MQIISTLITLATKSHRGIHNLTGVEEEATMCQEVDAKWVLVNGDNAC